MPSYYEHHWDNCAFIRAYGAIRNMCELTYMEHLAMCMTCPYLYDNYKLDGAYWVKKKFEQIGLKYVDVSGTCSVIAGGFMTSLVLGLDKFGDIDIFTPDEGVLEGPYYKPAAKVDNGLIAHEFADESIKIHGPYMSDATVSSDLYQYDYSAISQQLYFHSQMTLEKMQHESDRQRLSKIVGDEPSSDWNIFRKNISYDNSEKTIGSTYAQLQVKYLRVIRNFYLGTPEKWIKNYKWGSDDLLSDGIVSVTKVQDILLKAGYSIELVVVKVQDIVLNAGYSIDLVVSSFDLTLSRVYFDGKNIKFGNLEHFFRKKLLMKVQDATVIDFDGSDPNLHNYRLVANTLNRYAKYYTRLGGNMHDIKITDDLFEEKVPEWLPPFYQGLDFNRRILIGFGMERGGKKVRLLPNEYPYH